MADLLTYGPVVSEMHCQCYPVIRHCFPPLVNRGRGKNAQYCTLLLVLNHPIIAYLSTVMLLYVMLEM